MCRSARRALAATRAAAKNENEEVPAETAPTLVPSNAASIKVTSPPIPPSLFFVHSSVSFDQKRDLKRVGGCFFRALDFLLIKGVQKNRVKQWGTVLSLGNFLLVYYVVADSLLRRLSPHR